MIATAIAVVAAIVDLSSFRLSHSSSFYLGHSRLGHGSFSRCIRLMQSIPLLMVCLCQILHYIVLLLGAWYILLLLVLILLMLFMLLVSLLLLPLQFLRQLFFVFCGIFEVQSFRVFYCHLPHLWSYMHTLMLIMEVTH